MNGRVMLLVILLALFSIVWSNDTQSNEVTTQLATTSVVRLTASPRKMREILGIPANEQDRQHSVRWASRGRQHSSSGCRI